MEPTDIVKFGILALYVCLTFGLSWIGMRKTRGMASFAIGNRDMGPVLIGITMAASIASGATFIINPGFVYTDGVSAFLHYGVAAPLGILAALVVLTKGFRRLGEKNGALTIPHWIRNRYGSPGLALFFAAVNLVSFTFLVLIVVGSSYVLMTLLDLSYHACLVGILAFVLSYVLLGGTYAHAYTNAFQGAMMVGVSLFIAGFGLLRMEGGFAENLAAISENYAAVINPGSVLYNSVFSIFVSGFFITAALMFQPHILTKVLYLKRDEDVNRFLLTAFLVGSCFSLMLLVGFFARFDGMALGNPNLTVAAWTNTVFSAEGTWGAMVLVLISVTLFAASMSTVDGMLVALSAMIVNDLYTPFAGDRPSEARGLLLSRVVLVLLALGVAAVAWTPEALGDVGIFAQIGVYGLAAASFVPVVFGTVIPGAIPSWIMGTAAAIGFGGHYLLRWGAGIPNPAVSACWSLFAAAATALVLLLVTRGGRLGLRS